MTTISTFATAVDVTISELRLEAFLPVDQATAALLAAAGESRPGPFGKKDFEFKVFISNGPWLRPIQESARNGRNSRPRAPSRTVRTATVSHAASSSANSAAEA